MNSRHGPAIGVARSDAGTMRCSARDLELLRFVGEQYAVTLPQLARLMGCSPHAARWLRARWERAGWARGRAMLVGEPVFVWLTRRGQTLAGVDYAVWRPNPGMLAHIAAVTDVRHDVATAARRRPMGVRARASPRAGLESGGTAAARPDGIVLLAGSEVAVEVELTLKRRARVESCASSSRATAR